MREWLKFMFAVSILFILRFSCFFSSSPWEEYHVEDKDEGAGAEDGDDDRQDDVKLAVLLLLQTET